ncbi:hypothetical protein ARMSODRAFT_766103 [Armillaria solidipes]|uniref:DUF6534 domain-containing protein n=1 Tax=Armillaria solidipes TaxID=1076256 RepID=A0A2H3AM90_9AGAR|nr:hypothetical protein ARMSODRAFT_766103 [Armillaria solidipes]
MSSSSNIILGQTVYDISKQADPLFYGYTFSTILFGIVFVQGWTYINANNDTWGMRALVALLVALETVSTCVMTQIMQFYFIQNYGNLEALVVTPTGFLVEISATIVIILMVRIYFVSKLYLLQPQNRIVPVVVMVLGALSFGAGLAYIVDQAKHPTVDGLVSKMRTVENCLDNAFAAAADLVTTIALSVYLSKSCTGIQRTDTILQNLFKYILGRGILVFLMHTVKLTMQIISPKEILWMPIYLCLSKVYTITMLAALNYRPQLQEKFGQVIADGVVYDGEANIRRNIRDRPVTAIELRGHNPVNVKETKIMVTTEQTTYID